MKVYTCTCVRVHIFVDNENYECTLNAGVQFLHIKRVKIAHLDLECVS